MKLLISRRYRLWLKLLSSPSESAPDINPPATQSAVNTQGEGTDSGLGATEQASLRADPVNTPETSVKQTDVTQLDREQFSAEWLKQLKRLDEFMERGARESEVAVAQRSATTEERGFQTPLAWAPRNLRFHRKHSLVLP